MPSTLARPFPLNRRVLPPGESDRLERLGLFLLVLGLLVPAQAQTAPTISRQPVGLSRSAGDKATLTVNATGDGTLDYQWRLNGSLLGGATNRTLFLTNLTTVQAGSYTVEVSNLGGRVTSEPAVLDIDPLFTLLASSPVGRDSGWGASWVDYDGDDFIDLYVAGDFGHLLYHNERNGTFVKTSSAGALTSATYIAGSVTAGQWVDYDGDGHPDLFVPVSWGNSPQLNQFFRGLGRGGFAAITAAPVGREITEGACSAWADFNRDGVLDLFVGNVATDAFDSKYVSNAIYLGQRDGSFVRWRPPGFDGLKTRTYACAVGDYNGDGWPDIALATNVGGSRIFLVLLSLGGTDFEAVSLSSGGVNYGGISAADFDNNGTLDLFGSWANGTSNRLFVNDGLGNFAAVPDAGPAMEAARAYGAAWGDFDNDGYPDLYVARTAREAHNDSNDSLWHNNGDGTFTRLQAGSLGSDGVDSWGPAWGDFDNDGFLDLAVAGFPGRLYRNNGNANGWLMLKLVGTKSNRAAIGAKVRLTATLRGKTVKQFREVGSGNASGQNDPRVHFGLADATQAESIEIEWPSGTKQTLSGIAARQVLTVTEPDDHLRVGITRVPGPNGTRVKVHASGRPGAVGGWEYSLDGIHWAEMSRLILGADGTGEIERNEPSDEVPAQFFRAVLP